MTTFLDLVDSNRPAAYVLGALLLVGLILAARWARAGNQAAAYRWAAGAVALALSAEGMWEVATEAMHLAPWKAGLLFAFAELAMLNEARRAKRQVEKGAGPGVHGAAVWVIALGAGVTAASNATSVPETMIRLFAPTLIAWQWWSDLTDDRESTSRWVWTPERIGVRLGLLKPGGADDLAEVFRQRRIDRMVRLADRLDLAGPRRARRLALRLRRMAAAHPDVIEAVALRYRQGTTVQEAIFGRVRVEMRDRLAAQGDDAPPAQPLRIPVAHLGGTVAQDADDGAAHPEQALPAQPPRAAQPAISTAPARRGRVVFARPVSAPPASPEEREAAIARALAAHREDKLSIRAAARQEGVAESTLRTRLAAAPAELTHAHNGHDHTSQN